MKFNPDRVRVDARQASTTDLLNRVTVYRAGMEPEAIPILQQELFDRGVTFADIVDYDGKMRAQVIILDEGYAPTCSFCRSPAVATKHDWHRIFGLLPLIPKQYYYCADHLPASERPKRPEGPDTEDELDAQYGDRPAL